MHIFREPNSADVPALMQARLHNNPHVLGNFRNWILAAQWLIDCTTDEWIMICEDDITWARNACNVLEYDLARIKPGSWHAISLYCPDRMAKLIDTHGQGFGEGLTYGWYSVSAGKKMWGAQCLVFARSDLVNILRSEHIRNTWRDSNASTKNIDLHISEAISQMGKTILYRIPCLVDHVLGDKNSSLYGDKARPGLVTKYFKDPAC